MRGNSLRRRGSRYRSSISVAAAAVASGIFAQHTRGVTLNQYYFDVSVYSDAGLTDLISSVVVNQSNPVVNIPMGDYLSFGISDVLTNNANPAAGDTSGKAGHNAAQPSSLGIAEMAYVISSSDSTAANLAPNLSAGVRGTWPSGQADYYTTAVVMPTAIMPTTDPGDIVPGSSSAGDVGMNFQIFAGSNPTMSSGSTTGVATLSVFTPVGGSTATLATSTPLFDYLSYQGVSDGTVTLTPNVALFSYWMNTSIGSGTIQSGYAQANFGSESGDTIVSIPALTVNVFDAPPPTHSIISLTDTPSSRGYAPAYIGNGFGGYFVTPLNFNDNGARAAPATENVAILGLIPTPQTEELFAFQMSVTGSQLETLAADINSTNIYGFGAAIASTSLANDPFPSNYNLFLTFDDAQLPLGMGEDDYLTFDFTQDPNVTDALVDNMAVTAVPEPMSLGLVVLGAIGGLLLRRRDRARS
jgi:hypothetical protein